MRSLSGAAKAIVKFACYRALAVIAGARRMAGHMGSAGDCRRILLVEISLLGDAVSFTSTLRAARLFWPGARIEALVLKPFAALVTVGGHVDGVLSLQDMGLPAYAKVLRKVRRRRYHLVLSMSPGLRNAGAAILGGSGAAAGCLIDRRFPPSFLNRQRVEAIGIELARSVEVDRATHISDRGLKILDALGADVPDAGRPEIRVSPDARRKVGAFLEASAIGDAAFAVLHPSAGSRERRWPVERFAELARRLSKETRLGIVWTGGRRDARPVKAARRLSVVRSTAFVGRGVDELAALIDRAALFVGNDSGPMHVAGALGTSLVGIFGPGDAARLLPRNPNACAVGGPHVPGGVSAIPVDEVMSAARQVLKRGRTG